MNEQELRNSGFADLPESMGDNLLLTREEFKDRVRSGEFNESNGKGYYATEGLKSSLEASLPNFRTDKLLEMVPAFVTHVLWIPKQQE